MIARVANITGWIYSLDRTGPVRLRKSAQDPNPHRSLTNPHDIEQPSALDIRCDPISLCGHLDRESDSGKVCGGALWLFNCEIFFRSTTFDVPVRVFRRRRGEKDGPRSCETRGGTPPKRPDREPATEALD